MVCKADIVVFARTNLSVKEQMIEHCHQSQFVFQNNAFDCAWSWLDSLVSYIVYRKIVQGLETHKSSNELQVCASAKAIIVLSLARIPFMVIVYPIYGILTVNHI